MESTLFSSTVKFSWDNSRPSSLTNHIYCDCNYQSLIADYDAAEGRLLRCQAQEKICFLPLMLKEVGIGLFEAYSAYGYGGFIGDLKLFDDDLIALRNFLSSQGIIAAFLRHSPFLSNHQLLPNNYKILNRYTYGVNLNAQTSFEAYLSELPQKLRWSANYALRAGLTIDIHPLDSISENQIINFYNIYKQLMESKGTSPYYLFNHRFFNNHSYYLGSSCVFAQINDSDSQNLGGAFFLLDNSGFVHYHLSAASLNAAKSQGMELLILKAIYHFGLQGYSKMHLGGGLMLDEKDGLSRFKAKFSHYKEKFYCTKLVCDEVNYARERARLPLSTPSLFLISDARSSQPITNKLLQE